jgi:hypothetical protein
MNRLEKRLTYASIALSVASAVCIGYSLLNRKRQAKTVLSGTTLEMNPTRIFGCSFCLEIVVENKFIPAGS